MNYIYLILLWAVFYASHSFLASGKLKRKLESKLGKSYKWYRLFYSLFSLLFFVILALYTISMPAQRLLAEDDLLIYFGYMAATFGTIIIVQSSKMWSIGKFIGTRPEEPQAEKKLIRAGWYSRMRHPLYAGLFLIFLGYFFVAGTYSAMVHLACLIAYLPIGIYFEEKNLIAEFGDAYKKYREEVPAIFPKMRFW
jgi:protein-S-isoprenylcysteine O-methyltransferase Ste14